MANKDDMDQLKNRGKARSWSDGKDQEEETVEHTQDTSLPTEGEGKGMEARPAKKEKGKKKVGRPAKNEKGKRMVGILLKCINFLKPFSLVYYIIVSRPVC